MPLGRRMLATAVALSATSSTAVTMSISSGLEPRSFPAAEEDVSGCLLLFGAYANGNLGDIVQSSTMARLMANVAPVGTCIWHAHPSKETTAKGFREGEFFANQSAGLMSLGCDRESGEQVSRFKAFIIGGGGLFEAKHWPLDCGDFVDGLGDDLPVAIFGVGASSEAILSAPIIRRANYLSGRDAKSVRELSTLVGTLDNARSRPEDVEVVRDPVLSDSYFKDSGGACWRESTNRAVGIDMRPLCFVLPSATKENLQNLHRILSTRVVHRGDVLLNVFPKHQEEIQAYPYPSPVEEVMDPAQFATRLCGCRAVVASRLHGAIIALQAGVPTIAAWPEAEGNKVPDLMKDVLDLPDQFMLVDNAFSRSSLLRKIREVRTRYSTGQRSRLFEKLASIALHTQQQSGRMLADVAHLQLPEGVDVSVGSDPGGFWGKMGRAQGSEENLADEVGVATAPEAANVLPKIEVIGKSPSSEGIVSPWNRLTQSWRFGGRSPAPGEGNGVSGAGSVFVALAALVMIAALGLPRLAYRSTGESGRLRRSKAGGFAFDNEAESAEEAGEVATFDRAPLCGSQLGRNQFQIADFAFFGLNYALWVVLATGFNVCSKTYLRETSNPVALLAIQGWVGIIVLMAMNEIAGSRRRGFSSEGAPISPASCPATSPDSSSPAPSPPSSSAGKAQFSPPSSWTGPSWAGECGLREAKRLGQGVWQAGLFHSGNAVLTSWSVLVGGVAATHALKALEPVAAAGFSRWLLGSSLPPGRVVGVAIIVLGLGILMVPLNLPRWAGGGGAHSPDGDRGQRASEVLLAGGQDLALPAVLTACACCFVALRNVLLKKPDPPPPPPPLGLLTCSIAGAAVGSTALLVPWLPCSWEWAGAPLLRTSGINAALCAVGYNLASFNLLSELSPVGHAVGNASKRVLLFASGLFLLGEEGSMSPRQLAGASVAFVGLASYNLAGTFVKSAARSSR